MIRKIIKINEEKCNGCGACAAACHEGAIGMVGGKAKLMREDYCDGLGDCLPACPTGAITFEEREAPAYDHAAVMANKQANSSNESAGAHIFYVPQCGFGGDQCSIFPSQRRLRLVGSRSRLILKSKKGDDMGFPISSPFLYDIFHPSL